MIGIVGTYALDRSALHRNMNGYTFRLMLLQMPLLLASS